ncbi:MAG: peptidylprolyl isomerase [Acholeplasmataceae bacterium]
MQTKNPIITFSILNYGEIEVELFPADAPNTVNNFLTYVKENYYDNLIFHRIIAGFMIQGGQGASSHPSIAGEFIANGFNNPIKHTKGVISMARTQDKNSQTSQFFLMHENAPHLDGQYAAFGKTIKGQEIIDQIAAVKTNAYDRPLEDVVIKTIAYELNGYEIKEPVYMKKG